MKLKLFLLSCFFPFCLFAQTGKITGVLKNQLNNEPIPFANVVVEKTSIGAVTSENGAFEITGLEPGLYNLVVSCIGFKSTIVSEVAVTNDRPAVLNIEISEDKTTLDGVVVQASAFIKEAESPLSVRKIGVNEIKRSPGANRDVSKVIRALPGVASTVSFRNDIIIRGGAPNESKFYLDGIEVPVINHFQTQGSSGGPVGLINVDFLEDVTVYTGAYPAARGNLLSAAMEFKQKEGRSDKWTFNGIIGASDIGITAEGPLSKKSSIIMSVRRSYLEFLFKALELPFLPTYNDFQFKYSLKTSEKSRLTVLGIGAIDNFKINTEQQETDYQKYVVNNIPVNNQWNYALGLKQDWFNEFGSTSLIVSRNMLNNEAIKYENNDDSDPANLRLDYQSQEIENKIRLERFRSKNGWDLSYGLNAELVQYKVDVLNFVYSNEGPVLKNFDSKMNYIRYGGFVQASTKLMDNKMGVSLGARLDGADYSAATSNPLEQFSPRIALTYALTDQWNFNMSTGMYFQLPSNSALGYKNTVTNELENKANGIKYIASSQISGGVEYISDFNSQFSVEGFYKYYQDYPFVIKDSVSLANLGADFGVVGNDALSPISKGRAYGMEVLYQQKLTKGFYGIMAYTWVTSEFTDKTNTYKPSSWDFTHLVSLTGGKKFKRNWELGVRWLFTGASPFTPYDEDATLKKENWDLFQSSIVDYDRLNTKRLDAFHTLDIRIDKKYYFKTWTLNLYFDIQNFYNKKVKEQDIIDVQKDDAGQPIEDPSRPGYYLPNYIESSSGTIVPTLGFIFEF